MYRFHQSLIEHIIKSFICMFLSFLYVLCSFCGFLCFCVHCVFWCVLCVWAKLPEIKLDDDEIKRSLEALLK